MIYTIQGTTYFTDDSVNNGTVERAVFLGNAVNEGVVEDFAIFAGTSVNLGTVSAARFEDSTSNQGLVASATFTDTAQNLGVIEEVAVFKGDSINNGVIDAEGVIYLADNAQDNNGYQTLTYDRVDGAYYDGYFTNGVQTAPTNFTSNAFEVDYFWYVFDENGDAQYAHGTYADDNTGELWVFDTGVKVANASRINSDADAYIGPQLDGVINMGTGDRWYFYGSYFPSSAAYVAGKSAILSAWCVPGVDGEYLGGPAGRNSDIWCYNSQLAYGVNGYASLGLGSAAAAAYSTEYNFITSTAQDTQNVYIGKIQRQYTASFLGFSETNTITRWIYNHNIYDSRNSYANAYFTGYGIGDYLVKHIIFTYNDNDIITTHTASQGDEDNNIYITSNGSIYNQIGTARAAAMQSVSGSFSLMSIPESYDGLMYISYPGGSFTLADLSLTTTPTDYPSTIWVFNSAGLGVGTALSKAAYDDAWTQVINAAADAWGSDNMGEYIYNNNGTGRYYIYSSTSLTLETYTSTVNNAINAAAVSWCSSNGTGQFKYSITRGSGGEFGGAINVDYNENGTSWDSWCCDSTLYTTLTEYNNSSCNATPPNPLELAADAWGVDNNGRYIYSVVDGVYTYDPENGQSTNYFYCDGDRVTQEEYEATCGA